MKIFPLGVGQSVCGPRVNEAGIITFPPTLVFQLQTSISPIGHVIGIEAVSRTAVALEFHAQASVDFMRNLLNEVETALAHGQGDAD